MSAYYNEIDPKAAAWLRELIKARLIADGEVDERSITDVLPGELRGFRQCHFFAGIGGWSYALRLAGWPDDREVWTGSCPCQPFSSAGKSGGFADQRHLWPAFHWLVAQCRPGVVFGEQVASPAGRQWLDLVGADCEGSGYAFAAANLPAASVKAPHLRERLWWVADSGSQRFQERISNGRIQRGAMGAYQDQAAVCGGDAIELAESSRERREGLGLQLLAGEPRSAGAEVGRGCKVDIVGDASSSRSGRHTGAISSAEGTSGGERVEPRDLANKPEPSSAARELAHDSNERRIRRGPGEASNGRDAARIEPERFRDAGGFWHACDWIPCRDGKYRPVEPGSFPLAYGVPARVGRLRGYGNAINPEVAAEFIAAYLESGLTEIGPPAP